MIYLGNVVYDPPLCDQFLVQVSEHSLVWEFMALSGSSIYDERVIHGKMFPMFGKHYYWLPTLIENGGTRKHCYFQIDISSQQHIFLILLFGRWLQSWIPIFTWLRMVRTKVKKWKNENGPMLSHMLRDLKDMENYKGFYETRLVQQARSCIKRMEKWLSKEMKHPYAKDLVEEFGGLVVNFVSTCTRNIGILILLGYT